MLRAVSHDSVESAFRHVIHEFKSGVNDDVLQQILATKSVEDVYDATDMLQKEQAKGGRLRHLSKIQPFLENMREYAVGVEISPQLKSDVLALLWGPVKLLLRWTSTSGQSFDALIDTLHKIGILLFGFRNVAGSSNDRSLVKEVLLLFFQDILDFYTVALNIFGLPRPELVFDSIWPRHRDKIRVIISNIERHTLLLRNEVHLEHIQEERSARQKAFDRFELAEQTHRQQEYQAIKTDISPLSYEAKLDWLRGRVCAGTEQWLMMDKTYRAWVDPANSSSNVLWLQGIPGAGKTFLSGLVINETARLGATAYAFLSYNATVGISALEILLSLLFQLASNSEDSQEALRQLNPATLKSNIDTATDVLCRVLHLNSPAFLIIDGLDEIDIVERGRLLQKVLRVSNTCTEAKFLVSSRDDYDIRAVLEGVPSIQVNDHNTASIEHYVLQYIDKWFRESEFPSEMQSEIRTLLAPLSSYSDGMFLYAKIVLQGVSLLDEIEVIKDELKALPENLDAAYGRIFCRINASESATRTKARKILSWVGCSPTPLTIQELEAALLIRHDDTSYSPRNYGKLNVNRFCGPIVEVVEGFVQFVHFSVKEYIFSERIPNYIRTSNAFLELALSSISYLLQQHHDSNLSESELTKRIINGDYRLHGIASVFWYDLVETYASSVTEQEIPIHFIVLLERLKRERCIDSEWGVPEPSISALASLECRSPHVYAFLCAYKQFRETLVASDYDLNDAKWTNLDPTSLTQVSARVHHQLDELLDCSSHDSQDCKCEVLKRHYGPHPYTCPFINCLHHRYGFATRYLRKAHMKNHEHPWTCEDPDCEFFSKGFLSRSMRDKHWSLCHSSIEPVKPIVMNEEDNSTFEQLVLDLVETGDVELVRAQLLASPNWDSFFKDSKEVTTLLEAVGRSSPEMLDLFKKLVNGERNLRILFGSAAEANNLQMAKYLACRYIELAHRNGGRWTISHFICLALKSENHEIWEAWYSSMRNNFSRVKISNGGSYDWREVSILQHPLKQTMLRRFWKLLSDHDCMTHRDWGDALCAVTKFSSSIELAAFCLLNAANIEHRSRKASTTPLHCAVLESSPEKAKLVKFLLYRGADSDNGVAPRTTPSGKGYPGKRIQNEIGAREIQKWLGVTWTELVAEAKAHRKKMREAPASQNPGESVGAEAGGLKIMKFRPIASGNHEGSGVTGPGSDEH